MPWKVEWDKNSGRLEINQVKNTINHLSTVKTEIPIKWKFNKYWFLFKNYQELSEHLWRYVWTGILHPINYLYWKISLSSTFLRNTADINQIIWSRYKESWYKNINIKMSLKTPQQGKTIKISLKLKILHLLWARRSLTFSQL